VQLSTSTCAYVTRYLLSFSYRHAGENNCCITSKAARHSLAEEKVDLLSRSILLYETKECRYNWHSAGSLAWQFSTVKYKYIFQINYTGAILSNRTRKQLWFKVTKMLIAVKKINLLCYLLHFLAHFRSLSSWPHILSLAGFQCWKRTTTHQPWNPLFKTRSGTYRLRPKDSSLRQYSGVAYLRQKIPNLAQCAYDRQTTHILTKNSTF